MRFRAALLLGALLAVGVLAGCSSSASRSAKPGRCLAPLSSLAPSASGPALAAVASGPALPDASMGCLDGSGDVKLSAIGRPMIVSFWASYCQPCQAESPQVESFARAAAGSVAVIGVDTADISSKGRSFVSAFGLTYPMLTDPDQDLLKSVSASLPVLPTLLFVSAGGRIAHTLSSNQVDATLLRQLTLKYLGVTVA